MLDIVFWFLGVAAAVVLVTVCIYAAAAFGNAYAEATADGKLNRLEKLLEKAIRSAEEQFTGGKRGIEKHKYVLQRAVVWADKIGVDVDPQDLEDIIRGIYNTIKKNLE